MDSQGDGHYPDLIDEGSNLGDEIRTETSDHGDHSTQFSPQKESTNKAQRGTNFTLEEDALLVSAWLNSTSLDAIQGNKQNDKEFWLRVSEYFHKYKTFDSNRTQNSLMYRWSTIQVATNKFCSCFEEIEMKQQSGVYQKDKTGQAKVLFQQLYKTPFRFEHCWNKLRYQPKWIEESQKKKSSKKKSPSPTASSPSTPDTINLGNDNVSHDDIVDLERPLDREAEKDRLNKRTRTDSGTDYMSSPLALLLQETKEEKKQMNQKKNEMFEKIYLQEQKRLDLEQEKLRLEKLKDEERIMLMDLSGMLPMQAEYYLRRQREILGAGSGSIQ